ncbi:peptidase inhibitor family I36 protein [Saccharothrix deserti]|uniref:peptidase inhibitor family I36 protein n=1 Tax=Saccharothrix deserti TaxID=2593674 RepID=UPI00131C4856|nr:peptidase inhibitor family I36 protein [Saccharothrix deserti]
MRVPSFAARMAKLFAVVSMGVTAVVAPAASASATAAAWDCSDNFICFYQEADGKGKKCQYSKNHPRANEICSWGLVNAHSVRNLSNDRVHYCAEHNYKSRIGSTVAGDQGNLAGTYTIRSLKFD